MVWNPGFLQVLRSLQGVFFIFKAQGDFLSANHHVLILDSWMEEVGKEGYDLFFWRRLAISTPWDFSLSHWPELSPVATPDSWEARNVLAGWQRAQLNTGTRLPKKKGWMGVRKQLQALPQKLITVFSSLRLQLECYLLRPSLTTFAKTAPTPPVTLYCITVS